MIRDLASYWKDEYDWRRHEAAMNELPHFKTRIGDVDLHFIHVRPGVGSETLLLAHTPQARSSRADATPLLMIHGWPGSFYEFHKVRRYRHTDPTWRCSPVHTARDIHGALRVVRVFTLMSDDRTAHRTREARPDEREYDATQRWCATELNPHTAPAFHVIVPSLPGYGFSSAYPRHLHGDIKQVAITCACLMRRLRYERVAANGQWENVHVE